MTLFYRSNRVPRHCAESDKTTRAYRSLSVRLDLSTLTAPSVVTACSSLACLANKEQAATDPEDTARFVHTLDPAPLGALPSQSGEGLQFASDVVRIELDRAVSCSATLRHLIRNHCATRAASVSPGFEFATVHLEPAGLLPSRPYHCPASTRANSGTRRCEPWLFVEIQIFTLRIALHR